MEQNTEQWKTGGDCRVCRKQNYCQKPCSRNKRLMNVIIHEAIRKSKAGQLMMAARETMRESGAGPYGEG